MLQCVHSTKNARPNLCCSVDTNVCCSLHCNVCCSVDCILWCSICHNVCCSVRCSTCCSVCCSMHVFYVLKRAYMPWPNMFAHVFVFLYACLCVCVCMHACCMYAFMHVCLYACVRVHTCIFKVWPGNRQVCIEVFKGANSSKGSCELVTHIYQHAYRLGAWLPLCK